MTATLTDFVRWAQRDGKVVEWGNVIGVFRGQEFREEFQTEAEAAERERQAKAGEAIGDDRPPIAVKRTQLWPPLRIPRNLKTRGKKFRSCRGPNRCPWGKIAYKRQVAPGIVLIHTTAHFGFWISKQRQKYLLPGFDQGQFYPEEADSSLVVASFPEEFFGWTTLLEKVPEILREHFPKAFEALFGEKK